MEMDRSLYILLSLPLFLCLILLLSSFCLHAVTRTRKTRTKFLPMCFVLSLSLSLSLSLPPSFPLTFSLSLASGALPSPPSFSETFSEAEGKNRKEERGMVGRRKVDYSIALAVSFPAFCLFSSPFPLHKNGEMHKEEDKRGREKGKGTERERERRGEHLLGTKWDPGVRCVQGRPCWRIVGIALLQLHVA